MRRMLAVLMLVAAVALAGCSDDLDPIVGTWEADGPQPSGFRDFGDRATIMVFNGHASLGSRSETLCGGAEIKPGKGDGKFRIVFPTDDLIKWCLGIDVPPHLDIVADGDTMTATYTGPPTTSTYRLKRVSSN
jgi:hypothetical protein